jgi:hypothetical protein
MEPITVILQTYRRTEYALRTIAAARELLHYGGDLHWYVADDGSDIPHFQACLDAVSGCFIAGWHHQRRGYGANANAAWDAAQSALTFWLEDDFMLTEPLDLTPHAYTLMDCEEVGMVRLGYIHDERLEPPRDFAGRRYHTLPRYWPDTSFYTFTGHPSLRHTRYRDAYGSYPVDLAPGETELAYAFQYQRAEGGPLIVWPEGYPAGGSFAHIGAVKTEDLP